MQAVTSDELSNACVKGMAQVVKQVRAEPGVTERSCGPYGTVEECEEAMARYEDHYP